MEALIVGCRPTSQMGTMLINNYYELDIVMNSFANKNVEYYVV